MAGKRSIDLDLEKNKDRETLEALIADADVIIQGYRLGSLERRGFGKSLALKLAAARERGVVYLDENCYGPDGYYAERPGWQQIADAAAGSSYVIGKSYGFPDGQGVLPSLPISDMSTGILSAVNVMSMLRDRARHGGSWSGCSSLTGYNAATLQSWVGLYQPDIVKRIQDRFQFQPMTSDIHVCTTPLSKLGINTLSATVTRTRETRDSTLTSKIASTARTYVSWHLLYSIQTLWIGSRPLRGHHRRYRSALMIQLSSIKSKNSMATSE
jgi:hypothetical protein